MYEYKLRKFINRAISRVRFMYCPFHDDNVESYPTCEPGTDDEMDIFCTYASIKVSSFELPE